MVDRLTADLVLSVVPPRSGDALERQQETIRRLVPHLREGFARIGACTAPEIALLMGQFAHETAGFAFLEELGSGQAYEGRRDLGNDQPGDGARFKGRGILLLTGRANYRAFAQAMGRPDIMEHPGRVAADPDLAVAAGIRYVADRRILDSCGAEGCDVVLATRRINGGLNGLESRRRLMQGFLDGLGEGAPG
ncbi:glycoside hydrolase family 19 protein [Mangrovicoccus ximenensis]|uniref:glycoside hydrolase family 19 protein n=1 Tax=Mangrovicoccus ximenensis TaxID=1911570 RepID=UPI00191C59D1|nr:hypothetical protein [Mangrovicoccus ximenensis]